MGVVQGARVSFFSMILFFFAWEFVLSREFRKIHKFCVQGLAANWSSGSEKIMVCILRIHYVFCVFIIISSSRSISFVALLNCLYLNP